MLVCNILFISSVDLFCVFTSLRDPYCQPFFTLSSNLSDVALLKAHRLLLWSEEVWGQQMNCDTARPLHLWSIIEIRWEIPFVLNHSQTIVQETVKKPVGRREVSETRQQFGLFIGVSNYKFQPIKLAGVVHIENIYVKDNDKLMQRSWL